MSPIGKLFVVINVALAAVIFGVTASFLANNDDYRFQLEQAERDNAAAVSELNDEIAGLNERLAVAERTRAQATTEKNDLEVANQGLRDDLAAANERADGLQSTLDEYNSRLGSLTASLESMNEQAQAANEARVAAVEASNEAQTRAAEAVANAANAEDRANDLADQLADTRRQLTATIDDVQRLDTLLTTAEKVTGQTRSDWGDAAPPISGSVLAVADSEAGTLIQINRGSNDDVKPGYTFDVFNVRTGEYKGRAVVELVHASTSTARVTTAGTAGTSITQGDSAKTIL